MQRPDVEKYEAMAAEGPYTTGLRNQAQALADAMRSRFPDWGWRASYMPGGKHISLIGKPPYSDRCGTMVDAREYEIAPRATTERLVTEFQRLLAEKTELQRARDRIVYLESILRDWLAECPETCGQGDDVRERAEAVNTQEVR